MKKLGFVFVLLLIFIVGCDNVKLPTISTHTTVANNYSSAKQNVVVEYIDVGQADSILVNANGKTMLIDAGNNDDGDTVVDFIKNKGISRLDIVVGTHPHEDHIGGLDTVIDTFDVGEIILPKVSHTTKTYEDVLTSIKNKNLSVTPAKAGDKYLLGSGELTVVSPILDEYKNLNEYSVVMHMAYKNTSFLFTGDMERINEQQVLFSKANIKADVLKVAHHGSFTSSGEDFLNAVAPKYGIICVGKGNSFKHPSPNVESRLKKMMTVFRTDENGTITITGDGDNLTVETKK